eukprot:3925432-Prymnesium_polylepis.1
MSSAGESSSSSSVVANPIAAIRRPVHAHRGGHVGRAPHGRRELVQQLVHVVPLALVGPLRLTEVGARCADAPAVRADRHVATVVRVDDRERADALGEPGVVDDREQVGLAQVSQRVSHAHGAHVVDVDAHCGHAAGQVVAAGARDDSTDT